MSERRPPGEARILDPLWIRAKVLSRLVLRFNLSDQIETPDTMMIPRTIQAVTDVDRLLTEFTGVSESKNLTAGAGTYVPYHLVPVGKLWRITRFRRSTTVGSTSFNVVTVAAGSAIRCSKHQTAEDADTVDITLAAGATAGLLTTGNGADTAVNLSMIVEEQDAFRA